MQLSDLSVRRPVFAAVMAILLTIVGIVAFLSLSVREYPDTDPPIVSVETTYTGAAASVIEARITQPLEEALSGIEGIETITSRSRDGASDISIEFRPGPQHRCSGERRARPCRRRDRGSARGSAGAAKCARSMPMPRRSCSSSSRAPAGSRLQLSDYVDRNLVDRFATIDGVARVFVGGEARPSMRVWLDADQAGCVRADPGRCRDRAAHARMSSCPPGASNRSSRT